MSDKTEKEKQKKPRLKPGRRLDSTLEPYAKELIRNAGAAKRCEDSQECAKELLGLFIRTIRKYDEPLFWISAPEDSFSSTGLFPEDRYKKESMTRFTFRIKNIRGSADPKKILGTQVTFERAQYPKSFSLPPMCSLPVTEILNRMMVNDRDSSIYFLNKEAYREYMEGAKEIVERHIYNTEANRLVRDNYLSIIKDLDHKPQKYDMQKMHIYWEEEGKKIMETSCPYDRSSVHGIGARTAAESLFNEMKREDGKAEPGPVFTI